NRVANSVAGFVFQNDFGIGHNCAGNVGDRGAYRSARELRENGCLREQQKREKQREKPEISPRINVPRPNEDRHPMWWVVHLTPFLSLTFLTLEGDLRPS